MSEDLERFYGQLDLYYDKKTGESITITKYNNGTQYNEQYKIDKVLDSNRVAFVYECAGSKFIIYQLKESKYDKNKLDNYSDGLTKTNNDGTVESLCFDGILYTDNEKNRVIVAEKKGNTLKDYIEKNNTNNQGQTSLEERKVIFKNILEKVSEAHKYNIIHRNLCPANIIIIDNNEIKLLGCEIAYLYNADESDSVLDELIDPRQDIEHYAYKSPEQICYSSVDKQSDIFSLGIICYELFTGEHPFINSDADRASQNDEEKVRLNEIRQLLQNIATKDPRPLKECNCSLPPGLDNIISQMLNKSVGGRYKNVEEIKNAFDKILFDFQIGNTVYYDKDEKEWKKFDKSLKSAGEILTWVVLDNNGKAALLLSEKGLCGKSFHDKSEDATWDTCSLREWLNKDFKEKFLVIKNNDKIETDFRDKIDETRGGVFCLSHQDVEEYFKDKLKDYKKCMMANENIRTVWTKDGNCNYWLRDEGGIDRTAKYIDFDGNEKSALKTNTDIAVRPAFWIKLD